MPMVDVYAVAGTFADKYQLAQDAAKTVMRVARGGLGHRRPREHQRRHPRGGPGRALRPVGRVSSSAVNSAGLTSIGRVPATWEVSMAVYDAVPELAGQ